MGELEVQGLVKRFGENLVVDRISFRVNDGEFFVLLGPSGGGKTTLLRLIAGLEQADDGRILLAQRDITKLPPRERNLGMVFQDYGLYPSMDVYGNIAYGLEARNVPRAEVQKRVPMAAEMLGLTPLLKRRIAELSGGEQQRVALARIMARDADAFLYDEPLSNLDPKLRYQARRDILRLHRLKQRPSVYVTHDQSEAFAVADRIAVIARGRLQQIGTPDDLIEAPCNLYMARFVGTPPMNLLSGRLVLSEGQYAVESSGLNFGLPAPWKVALNRYGKEDVMLGFRPNALVPQWEFAQLEYRAQPFFAQVIEIEVLVGEMIVTLKLDDGQSITAVFAETEAAPPAIGDSIQVSIDPERISLFDPTSEQALRVEGI